MFVVHSSHKYSVSVSEGALHYLMKYLKVRFQMYFPYMLFIHVAFGVSVCFNFECILFSYFKNFNAMVAFPIAIHV